jgi:pyrroloquinoline quinone biosynthesis protein B
MRVKLLGTAAGGAFPQWNCACANCRAVRNGHFHGKARTQLQVAVSADNVSWFLLNVSPDIRCQLEPDPAFHPRQATRATPIAAIVLTGADLDQVLGLLMLREFQQFRVYAMAGLQQLLRGENVIFESLNRVPDQVTWEEIVPGQAFTLICGGGKAGLSCSPIALGEHMPRYISARKAKERQEQTVLGLTIQGDSGRRLGYFPAVAQVNEVLKQELTNADVLLFDGTFWSDDELQKVRGAGPTGREIGHVPVSGDGGSLEALSGLKARKIYVHINNTNPMLDESGSEYRQVREAGWEIGEDGWEFEL